MALAKRTTHTTIKLTHGAILLYNLGQLRLHLYQTNDALGDFVPVVENAGQAVVIENPSFCHSSQELSDYLAKQNIQVVAKLLAYHMAGASFLPQVPAYATQRAVQYGTAGGGKALVDGFVQTFGADFDAQISPIDQLVQPGELQLAGISFQLLETADAFDVAIPQARLLYLHLLGGDSHSLVLGPDDLKRQIQQLGAYLDGDYRLFVSAHHLPESAADVSVKLAYLQKMAQLAKSCNNAQDFQAAMLKAFPNHQSQNFLEMSAPAFY